MNYALLAAAATGVQAGAAIVASRFAVAEVPPLTLAMLRYGVGFLILLPFVWSTLRAARGPWPPPLHLGAMAALGIGQFGIQVGLLNIGLQHLSAAQAALIFSLFPLLTLLLAAAFGRERMTPMLLGGVLLSISGVVLSLAPKLGAPHGMQWWGEAAVLGAATVGALCSVWYRPWVQRYPVLPVSAWAMLSSVLFLSVLALGENWPARVTTFSAMAWAAVVFAGLTSAVGYYWWLYALKHESPTRVTVFQSLAPVTAAVLGWALLQEPLHATAFGALALIAAGLWLATRPAKTTAA